MIGIYKIQSIIKSNRIYIGSSININRRWQTHITDLKRIRHRNKKLQRHYNKYGKNDLVFSIILLCEIGDLVLTEQYYLDEYKPYFNILKIAGISLGYKHSEKVKEKMRKPKSKEHIEKLSKAKLGIKTGRVPTNKFKKGYIPWNKGVNKTQ